MGAFGAKQVRGQARPVSPCRHVAADHTRRSFALFPLATDERARAFLNVHASCSRLLVWPFCLTLRGEKIESRENDSRPISCESCSSPHVRGEFPGRSTQRICSQVLCTVIRREFGDFRVSPGSFCLRSNKQLSGLNQELNRCALSAPSIPSAAALPGISTPLYPPEKKSRRSMANTAGLSTIKSGTETYMTLVCASSQRTSALRSVRSACTPQQKTSFREGVISRASELLHLD